MKIFSINRTGKIAATIVASVTLSLIPTTIHVLAFNDGQIEAGDIYRIEDLTQNSGFSDNTSANACDLLEYRARLYNPGSATISNVNVQADVSNEAGTKNTSTLQASSQDADPNSISAFATVNLSTSQTLSYVNGTTQLLDQNDNFISTLPDTITISGRGVNIGNLGPSEIEYVQFQEKVSCPSPTPPPPAPVYSCNELGLTSDETNRTIKLSSFNTTATNGATFNNAVINWGDNSTPLTTSNVVGQTHQYSQYGTYTVSAIAHFTVNGQDVTAGGAGCTQQVTFSTPPPSAPVYTCNEFDITPSNKNRTVTVNNFAVTAKNGASFNNVVINWGDNSTPLTTSKAIGQTHQYGAVGSYTVSAVAHFTVNGQDVTAGGPDCQEMVTFSNTKPPTVTPSSTSSASATSTAIATATSTPTSSTPAPTSLVNTGPGSVAGIFGATTAAGAVAYRWLLSRRLSRQ